MTSPQANSLIASLEFLPVILGVFTYSFWCQFKAYRANRKRREDAGEIPYVSDRERAASIAQHPLLHMKKRGE